MLEQWIKQQRRFSIPKETRAKAIEQYFPDYEIFPSEAELNFITSHVKEARIYGSLMPEVCMYITVGTHKLSLSEQAFTEKYCNVCPGKGVCPGGLKVVTDGLCIHSLEAISTVETQTVKIHLPKTVIARVGKLYYLFAYKPEENIKFFPLTLFNTFPTGEIPWKMTERPKSLREAWDKYWTSVFKLKLLPEAGLTKETYLTLESILNNIIPVKTKVGTLLEKVEEKHILPPSDGGIILSNPVYRSTVVPAQFIGTQLYVSVNGAAWFINTPTARR